MNRQLKWFITNSEAEVLCYNVTLTGYWHIEIEKELKEVYFSKTQMFTQNGWINSCYDDSY